MNKNRVDCADARVWLAGLPDESVDCIVTSPPYWGQRNYGNESSEVGREAHPAQYVTELVAIMREAKRVLKASGTMWLNIGDKYGSNSGEGASRVGDKQGENKGSLASRADKTRFVPAKSRMMLPERVALAMVDDGWILRQTVIWHKPNAMPESVNDRPSTDFEYVYLFAKSPRYHYDKNAVMVAANEGDNRARPFGSGDDSKPRKDKGRGYATRVKGWKDKEQYRDVATGVTTGNGKKAHKNMNRTEGISTPHGMHVARVTGDEREPNPDYRPIRAVWTIPVQPTTHKHYASFPEELVRRCVVLGCPVGGLVCDMFAGSGTTMVVANANGRHFVGCDLNPDYVELANSRYIGVQLVMFEGELLFDSRKSDSFSCFS